MSALATHLRTAFPLFYRLYEPVFRTFDELGMKRYERIFGSFCRSRLTSVLNGPLLVNKQAVFSSSSKVRETRDGYRPWAVSSSSKQGEKAWTKNRFS